MTEHDFLNMCEERSLSCKCGNPLCTKDHKHQPSNDSAKIDWDSLAILKVSVNQHWCSKECHIRCAQFAKSLGNAMDRLEVLQKLRAGPSLISHNGSSGEHDDRDAMMKGILGGVHERSAPKTATVMPALADAHASVVNDTRGPGAQGGSIAGCADQSDLAHAAGFSDDPQSTIRSLLGATDAEETFNTACLDRCTRQGTADAEPPHGCEPDMTTEPKQAAPVRRRSRASELLKGIQQSLKTAAVPAEVGDFDLTDSDEDVDETCNSQCVPGPRTGSSETVEGESERPCAVAVSLTGSTMQSLHSKKMQGDDAAGAKLAAGPAGDVGKVSHPSVAAGNGLPAADACSGEPTRPTNPASYTSVKGKFKPRVAKTTQNPNQQLHNALHEPHGEQSPHTAGPEVMPAFRSSVAASTAPTSQGSTESDVRAGARPGKKRIAFSSCQMLEYDPTLPPAESVDEDCMCEVPVLPAGSYTPLQGFQNSVISAQPASDAVPAWSGLGRTSDPQSDSDVCTGRWVRCGAVEGVTGLIERAAASGSSSELPDGGDERGCLPDAATTSTSDNPLAQDAAQGVMCAGTAAATPDSAHDGEVTPVLYFDVHTNRSQGEMEGALRVTTAEALQLSEEDLAELQAQAHTGSSTSSGYVLDVKAGDVGSSDEDSVVEADEPASEEEGLDTSQQAEPEITRRPRLRRRMQLEAAVEVSPRALSAEHQHQLNRQAVADAFRYYLAPEAGGVGVAATGSALHELASDLSHRASSHSRQQAEGRQRDAQESSCMTGAADGQGTGGHTCAGDVTRNDAAAQARRASETHTAGLAHDDQLSEEESDSSADSWTGESECGEDEEAREAHCATDDVQATGEQLGVGDGKAVDGYFDAGASAAPRLSVFGVAWRLLGVWACQASVLHLHKRDLHPAQCFPELTRQVRCRREGLWPAGAVLSVALMSQRHMLTHTGASLMQGQRALTNVLLKRVAPLLESLGMSPKVPVAPVEAEVHGLLATLDVRCAVPTMAMPLQNSLVLVLLAAVSRHRMPQMADALKTSSPRMAAALEQSQLTPHLFSCLVDCLIDPPC